MGKTYTYQNVEENKALKAWAGMERVHFKPMQETGHIIRGMKVQKALEYLEGVCNKERAVPFFRYNKGISHHAQGKEFGTPVARWPLKSAQTYIKLIKNALAQAEDKKKKGVEINTDELVVAHVQCNYSRQYRWRRIHQAHGRVKSFASYPTNVQIVLGEPTKIVIREREL